MRSNGAYVILVEWLAHLASITDPRDLVGGGQSNKSNILCANSKVHKSISTHFGLENHRMVPLREEWDHEVTMNDTLTCLRRNCQKPVLEEDYEWESAPRDGPVKLNFADLRGRLSGMVCNLCGSVLHGPAVERNRDGNVVFVGSYENGVRSGLCWLVNPHYTSALVAEVDGQGEFTGENVAFVFLDKAEKDVYAYVGKFEKGIMLDAVRMGVEVQDGDVDNVFSVKRLKYVPLANAEDEGLRYNFKPGPNLKNNEERITAQAVWIWNHVQTLKHPIRPLRPSPYGWQIGITGHNDKHETLKGGHSITMMWKGCPFSMCRRIEDLMYGKIGQYEYPVWFVCYPGSASKAIINFVSMPTGHSIRGPPEISHETPLSASALIKTHHQSADSWFFLGKKENIRTWLRRPQIFGWRMWNLSVLHGRSIILIRNPYDALLSHWSHQRTDGYNDNTTLYNVEDTTKSELFSEFVIREMRLWEEIYLDFLTLGSEVLVIHKEVFFKSPVAHTKRMLHFVGLNASPQRLLCTFMFPWVTTRRRRQAFEASPFSEAMHEAVEAAMERVDRVLRDKGHEPLPVQLYRWARKKSHNVAP